MKVKTCLIKMEQNKISDKYIEYAESRISEVLSEPSLF